MKNVKQFIRVFSLAMAMSGGFVIISKPVAAQTTLESKGTQRQYHVKLSRTVNGKTTLLDTTIIAPEGTSVRKMLTGRDIPEDHLRPNDFGLSPGSGPGDSLRKVINIRRLKPGQAGKLDSVNRFFLLRDPQTPADSGRVHLERQFRRLPLSRLPDSLHADYLRLNLDSIPGRVMIIKEFTTDSVVAGSAKDKLMPFPAGQKKVIIFRGEFIDITAADKKILAKVVPPAKPSSKKELKISDLKYFPNPSDGKFKLSFSATKGGYTAVKIYNQGGKEVFSEAFQQFPGSFSREIDISKFGSGIFFLHVVQGNRTLTKKLLIK